MDKSVLLAKRKAKTRKVEVEGGTVTVRGLTRGEVASLTDKGDEADSVKIVAAGLVDPADMSEDEVRQWADACVAGDFVAVLKAITELSGIAEGAAQKSVPRSRGRK